MITALFYLVLAFFISFGGMIAISLLAGLWHRLFGG
jgi:hypothetical protein